MRESKAWRAARRLPRHTEQVIEKAKEEERTGLEAQNKARTEAFQEIATKYQFNAGSIQKFGEQCRDACWIGDHLGSHDTQTTSLRAFRTAQQHLFGIRGRPRFRRRSEFQSIEGKEQAVIRFKADPHPAVYYAGLVLPLILDRRDKRGWQKQALQAPIKYTRLVAREVRGHVRWYAQLVLKGLPPTTEGKVVGDGEVALDHGPSTFATFSLEHASLESFCPAIDHPWKEIRRLERAMDRSRRATNPDNFNADGTIKKGPKKWNRAQHYHVLARSRRECERRLRSERKRSQGELANQSDSGPGQDPQGGEDQLPGVAT
jgi:putative transposase